MSFHVSRFGVRIPVKIIFSVFLSSPNFLQRSIKGEYFLNKFYRLINTSCHWSHIHKKLPWLGFEPQTWKRGTGTVCCGGKEGKRPMIAYCFTQCSNGCSLGSFLFQGQDDHVQRCSPGGGWAFAYFPNGWLPRVFYSTALSTFLFPSAASHYHTSPRCRGCPKSGSSCAGPIATRTSQSSRLARPPNEPANESPPSHHLTVGSRWEQTRAL